jgi:TonB family protein
LPSIAARAQCTARSVTSRVLRAGSLCFTLSLRAAAQGDAEPPPALSPDPSLAPPRLIGEARADYPEGASGSELVLLHLVIDVDGGVSDVTVLSGAEPFASAAVAAARAWRFVPARRGDTPLAAKIRIELRFAEPVSEPPPIPSLPARSPAPAPEAPRAAEDEEVTEVLVLGKRSEPNTRTFTRAEVRQLPGAFGDPFRAIEALPGVTPIASGIPFFYVRGAPPGNVGYYLDGIRVPLLYHVGLGPSVVHPGMVDEVDLYPGAYPARYGRFAGGIVAGETTPPASELRGEWQLRPFDAGAMIELPFAGDRAYVLAGGRYSYTAFVISLFADDVRLEYWDYQLRAGYRLSDKSELSVFSFGSFDYFGEDTGREDDAFLSTEFHRVDLRYDHGRGGREQLRSALTLGFDRSRNGDDDGALIDRRIAWRNEYENQLGPRLRLRAGADAALDAFSVDPPDDFDDDQSTPPSDLSPGATPAQLPGDDDDDDDEAEFRRAFPTRRDFVAGAHVDLVWHVTPRVTLVPGVRSDVYASDGAVAVGVDPRIAVSFKVGERWTLKHALGIAHQPPSFVVPVPGFELGGLRGGLQQSVQASAGVDYRLPDDMRLSATLFHNLFFKLSDLLSLVRSEQALPDSQLDVDSRTRGQAYGLELMFQRDLTRRLGGFLSYTLSRSERFTSIGRIAAAFDRTHVASGALAYDLGRRWRAGGRLTYYTGTPASLDLIGVNDAGEPLFSRPERLSPFYRLDVRLEKRWLIGSQGAWWAFVFEVLNTTLNRELINTDCDSLGCEEERIGPVTVPSLGLEGGF